MIQQFAGLFKKTAIIRKMLSAEGAIFQPVGEGFIKFLRGDVEILRQGVAWVFFRQKVDQDFLDFKGFGFFFAFSSSDRNALSRFS